ncbi:hypothetical protein LOTGIDRAFT_203280 [Lottia gigantea]|uniref:Uncharacterized protein n=1 Tax=Lottia gigantea TaxID=225164 RepID=V3YX69_LOTGI|nr:hypothetical protein LOTGIDRAFT_203280 [Lottia gigantea]ESO82663.1 hypothetical protein LOTGIDRAFT_203280 [Lottia gigantea]
MANAAANQTSSKVKNINFVAQDQIWKDHVSGEIVAAKNWPETWDFLNKKYEDLVEEDFPQITERMKNKSSTKKDLTSLVQVRPVTPIEEYIHVKPSPRPFPKTTSQMVGWRSADRSLALEKYGKYSRPKGGLVKQLNWPNEAVS